jgi:hypothetical protein
MNFPLLCSLVGGAALLPASLVAADDTASAIGRPTVGFRVEYYANRLFSTSTYSLSTTQPVADYTFMGSTHSPRMSLAPMIEWRLAPHLSAAVELHFHHAQFQQVTLFTSGVRDPNSSNDDRKINTVSSTTKANYWEVPLIAHYYGLIHSGWARKAYATGGLEWRHVGRVRTGTEYSYANGATDYNEDPARPNRADQLGMVAGLGLRVMDALRIKVTPEVRYVRWGGAAFQGQTYRSSQNQLEISIGLSY